MTNLKVLVTGASLAGPVAAYWLSRYGLQVTVVEKADELRLGGQNIDVKGPAKEIAEKMGILDQIRAHNTTEVGIRFVDDDDRILAEFPKGNSMSMTQELEILRGDLVKILYDCTKAEVIYRFGDSIQSLAQFDDGVQVLFKSNKEEHFDLVISAEGIGSSTRELVLAKETKFRYLDLYTAYLTIPKAETDTRWARWHNAQGGVVFMLRPDNYGKTRASVTVLSKNEKKEDLSLDQKKSLVINRIKGTGWEAARLVKEIGQCTDLYFDKVSQVKASSWSSNRVAIVGDAAYCATPIAGKGTDLAFAGAYILAGELYRHTSIPAAFQAYERLMRPYADKCQKLPPGVPGLVYPTSKFGVSLLNGVYRVLGTKPVKKIAALFGKKNNTEREIDLPDYDQ